MTVPTPFATLTNQRVLVTGASSGIGRAVAWELARAGAHVGLHAARNRDALETLAAEIHSLGCESATFLCDFRKASGLEPFFESAWSGFGPFDVWVNNAGADLLTGNHRQLPFAEKLDRLLDVDVRATVHLSRLAGERMKSRGQGSILNIGWDQADRGMEGDSGEIFAASKNAIMGFTRSLSLSLAPQVRVNCIAPGWIRTAWGESAGPYWQQRVLDETPLQRWGTPEDVARLARFLSSSEAAYITGQVINANGGAVR